MKFAERVSAFMAEHNYSATQFGRAAVGDPNFVLRLRNGRQVTERMMDRVDEWMAAANEERVEVIATRACERPSARLPHEAPRVGPGIGAPIIWTRQLDMKIAKLRREGKPWGVVGAAIGVSRSAVHHRAVTIGLVRPGSGA